MDIADLSWMPMVWSVCRVPLQVAALCGVHCLNTLLQGPYFSGFELGQVRSSLCLCCALQTSKASLCPLPADRPGA